MRPASSLTACRMAVAFGAILLFATGALAQPGGPLPQPLPLFPADNWWNADISQAPVDPDSAAFIDFVGPTRGMHPDFGGDADPPEIYGMVWISVPGSQPLVPVSFVEYGDESDPGAPGRPPGYPIPPEAKTQPHWIEGGYPGSSDVDGDRHMLLVDRDNRILYELYHLFWSAARNRWEAGSGAVFPLTNHRRPEGWTSADAAGLAILPGLVRPDEVFGPDPIRHAFRVTVRDTHGHVFPASHTAGDRNGALPMGARLRLKANKDLSGYTPEVRKIFQAMKTYGLIVADNGSDLYVTGAYDTRWNNDVLNPAFASLHGSDFEVVKLGWQPSSQPAPPTAPANLVATATSASQIGLAWSDRSSNEDSFRVEMKSGSGPFAEVATVGANVSATGIGGLLPATAYSFRVRARNAAGDSAYSNTARATTGVPTGPCVASDTRLCLRGNRFQVEVTWTTPQGGTGPGHARTITPDTGYFWFFGADNVEVVAKIVDGCALGGRYWFFAGGLTSVRVQLTVVDTQSGIARSYTNPQGTPFRPIQDTGAFATCP